MEREITIKRMDRRAGSAQVSALILIAALAFLAYNSLYTVNEWEQAVVTQFGAIKGEPITDAGLHFKLPFVQQIHRFDRRLLRWDGQERTIYTKDRRAIIVDVTARWRIIDARSFLESIGGSTDLALARLDGIIEGAVRNEIGQYDLYEVVRSSNLILEREEDMPIVVTDNGEEISPEDLDLTTMGGEMPPLQTDAAGNYLAGRPVVIAGILKRARERLDEIGLGIHLEDVLIKQVNYTAAIEENVYRQMNAELQKISAGFRSLGQQRAEQRLGEMERELATIQSEAIERSERIRGTAEAEAIRIYAHAYNADPDFFAFLRTLQAYEKALGKNSALILGTESPLFELFKGMGE
jgi:modulator of FtsH protease HflC